MAEQNLELLDALLFQGPSHQLGTIQGDLRIVDKSLFAADERIGGDAAFQDPIYPGRVLGLFLHVVEAPVVEGVEVVGWT